MKHLGLFKNSKTKKATWVLWCWKEGLGHLKNKDPILNETPLQWTWLGFQEWP